MTDHQLRHKNIHIIKPYPFPFFFISLNVLSVTFESLRSANTLKSTQSRNAVVRLLLTTVEKPPNLSKIVNKINITDKNRKLGYNDAETCAQWYVSMLASLAVPV
jgi:hypothetical protein